MTAVTPAEGFSTGYEENSSYLLSGSLLNKLARMGNGVALINSEGDRRAILSHARITASGTDCPDDDNTFKSCTDTGRYVGRLSFYDASAKRWKEYDDNVLIDILPLFERTDKTGTGVEGDPTPPPLEGMIPVLSVNDVLPVFYDRQRGMYVPMYYVAPMVYGNTTAAVADTDETFDIDSIELVQGTDPRDDPGSTDETLTVKNVFAHEIDSGDLVRAERKFNGDWVSIQAKCPA